MLRDPLFLMRKCGIYFRTLIFRTFFTHPSDQNNVWDGICSTVLVPLPPIMTIPRDGVAVMVDLKQIFRFFGWIKIRQFTCAISNKCGMVTIFENNYVMDLFLDLPISSTPHWWCLYPFWFPIRKSWLHYFARCFWSASRKVGSILWFLKLRPSTPSPDQKLNRRWGRKWDRKWELNWPEIEPQTQI